MLKNITLSADAHMLERARERARSEKRTLNAVFREWINRYISQEAGSRSYAQLMKSLSYANAGRKFSREEMNAR